MLIKKDNIKTTLDAKHNNIIKTFKNNKKTLNNKKDLLKDNEELYIELSSKHTSELTYDEIDQLFNLKQDISNLKSTIVDIESNKDEYEYYLNTCDLLNTYYDNIDLNSQKKPKKKKPKKTKAEISNFFSNGDVEPIQLNVQPDEINFDELVTSISTPIRVNNKISDYINEEDIFKKNNILDEYLKIVDKNYTHPVYINNDMFFCHNCNKDKIIIQNEAIIVCDSCGATDYIIIESGKPTYKDHPVDTGAFSYKRLNHLREWLSQFQAKESTEIPDHVYDSLLKEIEKARITDISTITKERVRHFLKKLNLNKYYEHVPHIICRLNGKTPPRMSKELEEKIQLMFKEIQGPFSEICPPDRKNFLSYSYVLHKFVELLELDEYKECFPLLKSREKLHQQDVMWRQITQRLGWAFYKSI
jgi:hypothetical protein